MSDESLDEIWGEKFFSSEGLTPAWAQVRDKTLKKLLSERQDVDTVDTILLERLSYLYARIRQREAQGAFANERTYKAAMNLLSQFMSEVRKAESRAEMLELMRADVYDIVVKSVKSAVSDLPDDAQKEVIAKVIHLVDQPVA